MQLAAMALLAVVALDLAPDIARDVAETGSAQFVVGAACVAAFAVAALSARWACACGTSPTTTTGLAIAVHRTLEGAALVLVGSPAVIAALVLHAAGEGFALRTYGMHGSGRVRPVLTLACLSPAVGAAALSGV
jgi:ZIP family zinc transporter